MKKILICFLLTACGGKYEVSGNVTVTHRISLDELEKYFRVACEEEFGFGEPVDECVANKITDFLNFLEST